jgi:O-antigen/teichoic acid export membrane protein
MESAHGRFARNVIASFLSKVLVKIIGFTVTILLINFLGKIQFGTYAIIMTLLMIWMIFVDFGWGNMIIREISKNKALTNRYFANFLAFQAIVGVFFIALLLGVARVLNYSAHIQQLIVIACVGLYCYGLSKVPNAFLVAYEAVDLVSLIVLVSNLFNSALILLGVLLAKPLAFFIWINNAYLTAQLFLFLYFHHRRVCPLALHIDFALWRKLILLGLPFTLLVGASVLYTRIDVIMLSKMKDAAACGIYASAAKFVYPLTLFSEAVLVSLFPVLSRKRAQDPAGFTFAIEKTIKYLAAFSVPTALGITILAPRIITLLLKPEFAPATLTLQLLIWYLPIVYFYGVISHALIAAERVVFLTIVNSIAILVNVALNLLLIPKYSFNGAAVSTLLSEAFVLICFISFKRQLRDVKIPVSALGMVAIAGACMAGCLGVLQSFRWGMSLLIELVGLIAIGFGVFLGVLLVLRFIQPDERDFFATLLRR